MKRIIPFFLVLALCFTFLISPAAASSFDPGYITGIDVLDYVTADGDNSKSTGADTYATFVYDLPYKSLYTYVDAVVSTASGSITAAYGGTEGSAIDSSGKSTLTIKKFGNANRMHRIYGVIPTRNYQSFELLLKSSVADVSVNIISLKLSNLNVSFHEEVGSLSVSDWKGSHSYTQSAYDGVCTHTIPAGSGGNAQLTAVAALNCSNWRNYDYLEFYGGSMNTSFASISVLCDGHSIPYSVSYFGDPVQDALDSATTMRYFIISLDLRGINRSTSSYPQINITFTYPESQSASILISKVHGVVNEINIDPQLYFLRNIWDSLQSGFSNVVSAVNSAKSAIVKAIEGISIEVDSIDYTSLLLNIQGSLSGISTNLQRWLGDLIDTSSGNNLILGNLYKDLPTLIDSINSSIWSLDDQLVDQFDAFTQEFSTQISAFKSNVASNITDLKTSLGSKIDAVKTSVNNCGILLQQLIDGASGQDDADEFNDSVSDKTDELNTMAGVMDSVTPPDISKVNLDQIISPEFVSITTSGLSAILSNQIILTIFMMSMTMSLVGYILFGKKG